MLMGKRFCLEVPIVLRVISILIILSLFFISACNHKPDLSIADTLERSEEQLQKIESVKTTAAAFDGIRNIKFRLMVEGRPSKADAEKFFNKTLNTIAENSNSEDLWDNYDADFDIKSYEYGVIYEAAKPAGKSLKVIELVSGRIEN